MWYTITLLSLLYGISPFAPLNRNGHDTVRRHGMEWKTGYFLPGAAHRSGLAAQLNQTDAPDNKQSRAEKEDVKPRTERQDGEQPRQTDKKPALKDFVPSEQIDADKAVDFPADI